MVGSIRYSTGNNMETLKIDTKIPKLSCSHPYKSVADYPVKRMLTDEEFDAFLVDLSNCPFLRVCGSYARGEENQGGYLSDLDFYVLQDRKGIDALKEIFKKHMVDMGSCFVCCIGTPRNNTYAPFPVEFSTLFDTPKRKVIEVEIRGIKFKAYRQS